MESTANFCRSSTTVTKDTYFVMMLGGRPSVCTADLGTGSRHLHREGGSTCVYRRTCMYLKAHHVCTTTRSWEGLALNLPNQHILLNDKVGHLVNLFSAQIRFQTEQTHTQTCSFSLGVAWFSIVKLH